MAVPLEGGTMVIVQLGVRLFRCIAGKIGFDVDHDREQFIEYALPPLGDSIGIVFKSVKL